MQHALAGKICRDRWPERGARRFDQGIRGARCSGTFADCFEDAHEVADADAVIEQSGKDALDLGQPHRLSGQIVHHCWVSCGNSIQ